MIVSYSNYDNEKEKSNILTMLSKRVDGIIISPIDDKSKNIEFLIKNNINVVIIDCLPRFENISYVYTDHGKGAEITAEYLIRNGHKDILLPSLSVDFAIPAQKGQILPKIHAYCHHLFFLEA